MAARGAQPKAKVGAGGGRLERPSNAAAAAALGLLQQVLQKQPGAGGVRASGSRGRRVAKDGGGVKVVRLGGVPAGISGAELKANFSSAGTVKMVQLLKGGAGVVRFSTPAEARAAVVLFDGARVGGSALTVAA
ncbi:unnamed protein product [Prorocentrum cordatum]|uniref:RRM domain-containing protein n=1 Tax=Prorocentrum cordatum TaxID=2364126 RepID=A0ABN9RDI3_9DINO|nr:unnamed protein product [Polarella glacialis]